MIVAMGSVRGAPGVSVWSMLLAAAWPDDSHLERVVLEADLDGGVAGARYGVGVDPGTHVLVADLRHAGDPSTALHTAGRCVGDGAWLVPGPESSEAARRLWSADRAATTVASSLSIDDGRAWLCDVGRATVGSPVMPFISEAGLMLLFSRDEPADLVQVPPRVAALQGATTEVAVVIVGSPAYDRGELSRFFGCRRVWVVPAADDVVELSRQAWTNRRVRRSPIWRAAVSLADDVFVPLSYRAGRG